MNAFIWNINADMRIEEKTVIFITRFGKPYSVYSLLFEHDSFRTYATTKKLHGAPINKIAVRGALLFTASTDGTSRRLELVDKTGVEIEAEPEKPKPSKTESSFKNPDGQADEDEEEKENDDEDIEGRGRSNTDQIFEELEKLGDEARESVEPRKAVIGSSLSKNLDVIIEKRESVVASDDLHNSQRLDISSTGLLGEESKFAPSNLMQLELKKHFEKFQKEKMLEMEALRKKNLELQRQNMELSQWKDNQLSASMSHHSSSRGVSEEIVLDPGIVHQSLGPTIGTLGGLNTANEGVQDLAASHVIDFRKKSSSGTGGGTSGIESNPEVVTSNEQVHSGLERSGVVVGGINNGLGSNQGQAEVTIGQPRFQENPRMGIGRLSLQVPRPMEAGQQQRFARAVSEIIHNPYLIEQTPEITKAEDQPDQRGAGGLEESTLPGELLVGEALNQPVVFAEQEQVIIHPEPEKPKKKRRKKKKSDYNPFASSESEEYSSSGEEPESTQNPNLLAQELGGPAQHDEDFFGA